MILGNPTTEREPSQPPLKLDFANGILAAASFRGVGYKDMNEDRILIAPAVSMVAVIDGMGGPGGGETASEILAEELSQLHEPTPALLLAAQSQASERMLKECSSPDSGVCFVILWLVQETLHVCYAGDVKLIVVDDQQQIKLETRDHSLLNSWIDSGYLRPEEAINHPQRHIVTQALTGTLIPDCDHHEVQVQVGDRLVVATDGLWDNFTVDEVIDSIQDQDVQTGATSLMQQAATKMRRTSADDWEGVLVPKPDNISIVVFDI